REFSADALSDTHASLHDRGGAESVGNRACALLVDDVHVSVAGVIAKRQRNGRVIDLVVLTMAIAEKTGEARREIMIHANIALIVHGRDTRQRLVVVGEARSRGFGKLA